MTARKFPIRLDDALQSIPWDIIAPHEAQAMANHHRSLDQLAVLGGLTPEEALAVIEGRPWEQMPFSVARQRLIDYAQRAALQQAINHAPDTALDDALQMARNMRDGICQPTRWNFNKLVTLLERATR